MNKTQKSRSAYTTLQNATSAGSKHTTIASRMTATKSSTEASSQPSIEPINIIEKLRPKTHTNTHAHDKHKTLMVNLDTWLRDKWHIKGYIAGGSFGQVFLAYDNHEKLHVAIKLESRLIPEKKQRLKMEVSVLRKLKKSKHTARFYGCGTTPTFSYMAIELCSRNLADLRRENRAAQFSPSTAYKIGAQGVTALRDMHNEGYLHRDVKPSNFALGSTVETYRTLIILDFGLARRYISPEDKVLRPCRDRVGFRGTIRYASVNAHCHKELGRQDDLISLVYMIVEQISGSLPWRKVRERDQVGNMKVNTSWKSICDEAGPEIAQMGEYLTSLSYSNPPNYTKLLQYLNSALSGLSDVSSSFDWEFANNKSTNHKT